jgi:hypothetical protein
MEPSIERLWRKRAEYDARLSKLRSNEGDQQPQPSPPAPAGAAADSEHHPTLPQPPKPPQELQTNLSPQKEEGLPRAPRIETSQGTHSTGSSLVNRMASIVSSSSRIAPPSTGRQSEQVKSSHAPAQVTSSVAMAAFKHTNLPADDDVVSGISLMGNQLDKTVRRMNQSSVLQRSRTKGVGDIKAENTALLIQAVAKNDSNTVNSMLQQGLGSIDDTDSSGNSNSPPASPNLSLIIAQRCATSPA